MQISLLPICVFLFFLTGCANYYMPVSREGGTVSAVQIGLLVEQGRFMILRTPGGAYAMYHLRWDQRKNNIHFTIDTVPLSHRTYVDARKRNHTYTQNSDGSALLLNEAHLYTLKDMAFQGSRAVVIPVDSIERIEVLVKDMRRTRASHAVGYAVALGVLVVAIGMAIGFGCPGGGFFCW